jgi:hypothetical protein
MLRCPTRPPQSAERRGAPACPRPWVGRNPLADSCLRRLACAQHHSIAARRDATHNSRVISNGFDAFGCGDVSNVSAAIPGSDLETPAAPAAYSGRHRGRSVACRTGLWLAARFRHALTLARQHRPGWTEGDVGWALCALNPVASRLAPKLLGGEVGALPHRLELRPHHGRMHFGGVQRLRGEAAIGAGDDVLAPD